MPPLFTGGVFFPLVERRKGLWLVNLGGIPFGDYLLLDPIRVGGMAETYVARRRDDSKALVTVKRMLPGLSEKPEWVARFNQEAQVTKQLKHPNIVSYYEHGVFNRLPFIVLEYVHGRDLRAIARQAGQSLDAGFMGYVVLQVALGLQYAHEIHEVTHGDLSPTNILVSFAGEVKIIDFGLAQARHALQEQIKDISSLASCFEQLAVCPQELTSILAKAKGQNPRERYVRVAHFSASLKNRLRQAYLPCRGEQAAFFLKAIFAREYGQEQERQAAYLEAQEPRNYADKECYEIMGVPITKVNRTEQS